jgi:hypothetical protein
MTEQIVRKLSEPSDLSRLVFESLAQAVRDVSDPWRTPVLATVLDGKPSARTVVLRGVDVNFGSIWCYSDVLATKIAAVRRNCAVAWCFYDPRGRTQVRIEGEAVIETGVGRAAELWATLSPEQRRNYGSEPTPGRAVTAPFEIRWQERPFDYFAVVTTKVTMIDWLELAPDFHRRAIARWSNNGWVAQWVSP